METLKFVMTTDTYPPFHIGGDAVFVKYLAEELADKGHEVHVIHSIDAYSFQKGYSNKKYEKKEGLYPHPITSPIGKLDPYLVYAWGNSPFVYKEFKQVVKDVRPDVVHHHNISLLGYNLLHKFGSYQTVYTAHSYWFICPNQRLFKCNMVCRDYRCLACGIYTKRPIQLWRLGKTFRKSVMNIDYLTSPSEYVANKLSQRLGIEVIKLPYFVPEPPAYIEPSEFSDYFLYAGVLEKHKGILDLLIAYREIACKTKTKLLIAGDGSLKDKIRAFIKDNALENKVIFVGWADHNLLYRLLTGSNGLIIPSIWPENFPLIALEALSLGVPVIASNNGGLPEIVKQIDANLIFHHKSELKEILVNFDRSKYSRFKIRQIYERNYCQKIYLTRYFGLLKSSTKSATCN